MPNLAMPKGLKESDLECVMLDIMPLDIRRAYGPGFDENDLFYGDIPELRYAQGDVASSSPHVTILFGIHPSPSYEDDVMRRIGNRIPKNIKVDMVGYFPSSVKGQDYYCIVAHVVPTADLLSLNRRLKEFPYTTKFDTYKPHITLAYIKTDANLPAWIERMEDAFGYRVYEVTGLNLGRP